jgi:hypothetical protein
MMSTMDYLQNDTNSLSDVFANVPAVSSNSGGSWFLTQAAYSELFLKAIEAKDAWSTYTAPSGYMGQVWAYLKPQSPSCNKWLLAKPLCEWLLAQPNSSLITFITTGDFHWDELVRVAVFGAGVFPTLDMAAELKNTSLNTPRNNWSEDKGLVIAGALLTEQPTLTGKINVLAPLTSTFQVVTGSQRGGGFPVIDGAAPIMMGTMGDSGRIAPPFLTAGDMKLKYESSASPLPLSTTLKSTTSVAGLNVMHAAAISSAAGAAFIDSTVMAKIIATSKLPALAGLAPYVTLLLDNLAPAYKMSSAPIQYVPDVSLIAPQGEALPLLMAQKVNRTADGGFVDNTAVAYMLRHMQDNGELVDGFDMIFFDNMPTGLLPLPGSTTETFPTAGDVANLFGYPDPTKDTHESCLFPPLCLTAMSPHVFESEAYFENDGGVISVGTEATWSNEGSEGDCDINLRYVKYVVTIVANPLFGITKAGVKGVLHVFVAASPKTFVVPASDASFACYTTMVDMIHENVVTPGTDEEPSLGDYLTGALGIVRTSP